MIISQIERLLKVKMVGYQQWLMEFVGHIICVPEDPLPFYLVDKADKNGLHQRASH